jgi:hypothetical protein
VRLRSASDQSRRLRSRVRGDPRFCYLAGEAQPGYWMLKELKTSSESN